MHTGLERADNDFNLQWDWPRGSPIKKKKKFLSSGWHSTFIFLDLEIRFPLPLPSMYIFILL